MEVLTRLLNTTMIQGQIIYHPLCAKVSLTHLCFADDLMVFSTASAHSLMGTKLNLDSFCKLSRLKVSFQMSEVFFCVVSQTEQDHLARFLGVKIGRLPVRYLGVPLIAGKLRAIDWKPLVDKIIARISLWSSRFLSFGGRLQLISSVLASMYKYWCTISFLPKMVIKEVEKICNAFLWKGKEGDTLGARVNWAHVCKPKVGVVLALKVFWN